VGEAQERGVQVSEDATKSAAEPPRDGLTRADTVYGARIELLTAGIHEQIATPAARGVTPAQVDAYVDASPKFLPERRRIRILKARTRHDAALAKGKIAKGLTWRQAARRYGGSGNERVVERGDYPNATERAMFEARTNRLRRHRPYVFKVTKILPARLMPRAQQEAAAWEELSSRAQAEAIAAFAAGYAAKWRARTVCAPAYRSLPVCGQAPTDQ
jgi:foldase protein PrsA